MLLAKKFFEFHARVQKCHFGKNEKRRFSLMSNDENKFQPIFQILHIKSAWFLLELAMALVTTIGMRFLQVCNISGSENVLAMLCIGRKWTAKMILRPVRRQCSQQLNRELTLLQRMYCTALTGTKAAPIEIISRTTKEPSVVCCSCIRAYSYFWHTLKATMMSQFENVFFSTKKHTLFKIYIRRKNKLAAYSKSFNGK